jgi:probable F420-dependent oxidoreductase
LKIDGTMSWDHAADDAQRFERQGLDGAISTEGAREGFFPLLLAGQATEHLELMTGVAIALARNPMIVAQQANDLQELIGGRFLLGVGPQIRPHIENRFSMTWSRPAARMREFVLAIRAIWDCWAGGGRLDFRGEFYTHTLMTPMFNPGPNPSGSPPIIMAGVGERMVEVAGEVADGLLVHPLNSPDFVRKHTRPAVERGAARAGRSLDDFQLSVMTFCMMGSNDEEIERARNNVKAQMSFYCSTPAYRPPLDHHGWGELQPELNRLSKQGGWAEMTKLISDEMLDTFGVSGTPSEVGRKLRARNDMAQRTNLMLVNETDPEAVSDLVRGIKEAGN